MNDLPQITPIKQVYVVWQALIPNEPIAGCGFYPEAWPIDRHGHKRLIANIIENVRATTFVERIKRGEPVPALVEQNVIITFMCEARDLLEGAPDMDGLEQAPRV